MSRHTIKANEVKEGDVLVSIGGFERGAYAPLKVVKVEINTWSESVTIHFEQPKLWISVAKYWNLEVERDDEKAIYFFRHHEPVHEKLLPNSQLYKNSSMVVYKGEIVKNTLTD